MLLRDKDLALVQEGIETALKAGAQKARITLTVSEEDLVATLNGEIDKVTRCADTSLSLGLFVDGRYGSFSTNKLGREAIADFIARSIEITRVISPDPCYDLPDIGRCCRTALKGDELDLVDPERGLITPEERIATALEGAAYSKGVLSEEGEYSDSIVDTVLVDSDGAFCRHCETCFDYGVETTVEMDGEKYSSYWWDSSSQKGKIDPRACGETALRKARMQKGSEPLESGKYTMVVDSEVATKFVSPLIGVLKGTAIQQNNSFLMDSLGKKVFPESLSIVDVPHIKGETCSKLFDAEGVATAEAPIIDKGVVSEYFINTYNSRKLDLAPTIGDATRPLLLPAGGMGGSCEEILRSCNRGILVTGFNGGNSNRVTGDFSYGIEGFLFENGVISRPVSEMLVTGNFITLWGSLLAAGNDSRRCKSKLIPTLAFENVDFSG